MVQSDVSPVRRFEFVPTPAVLSARTRGPFIPCPVCDTDSERYLFHKMGVRFVRCRTCGLVYANPPATTNRQYFDVDSVGKHTRTKDRQLFNHELADIVRTASVQYRRSRDRWPRRIVVAGRTLDNPERIDGVGEVNVARLTKAESNRLTQDGDAAAIVREMGTDCDVLILNELLEGCPRSARVVESLADALPEGAHLVIVFSNVGSFPARVMRRHWPRFFAWKSVYFDTDNLSRLMDRKGLHLVAQHRRSTTYSLAYVAENALGRRPAPRWTTRRPFATTAVRLPAGTCVSTFERSDRATETEMLSVIVPVFNEAAYVAPVLDALLAKDVAIDKEVIVVESNSTDGTRDIVRRYEGTPGLTAVYEDRPRGKGSAVRRGLEAASGSIILIQDADFEYDVDDYDALLDPILQRRTSFVLGSRSLGLDDWKVRKYSSSRVKAFLMNFAQVLFAKTFNVLYQQRTTDVNTMFKVFRRECIENVDFRGNGFNFDIELVCKIVKNGFAPMEVPVNYVARGFDEGKKINFITEFYPSYSMLYRCRFAGRSRR